MSNMMNQLSLGQGQLKIAKAKID